VNSKETYLMVGNTRWHWAIKIEKEWQYFHTDPSPTDFKHDDDYSQISWAAVGPIPSFINLNSSKEINLHDVPLLNLPSYLGIDRALAAWSAFQKKSHLKNKKKDIIIIDAGTILSITRISKNGEFIGGQLIPGMRLQLSAMGRRALKLENPETIIIPKETFQHQTKNAMIKGTINCLTGAILQIYKETGLSICLCGGDAPIILNEFKNTKIDIEYHPNLVLEGMISIYKKN
tara:strand:+ start:2461 stop:3156 length:696 start_codon:yes stop_codon:yes gene_type:complete